MRTKGFTLVEMVLTIVVMGFIFIGVGSLLQLGSKGYSDSIERQKVQNQARFVIEKMSREIRHAVPNSFATFTDAQGDKCLSFYPIIGAGFYWHDEISNKVEFVVDNKGERISGATSDRLVINPSRQADLTDDDRSVSLSACRDASDSDCVERTLVANTSYSYQVSDNFASYSIADRYYRYASRVNYCISTGGLIRKSIGSGAKVTVAEGLVFSDSQFRYTEASLQRGGLVHLELLFTNQGEQSFYKHDVQVLNVP